MTAKSESEQALNPCAVDLERKQAAFAAAAAAVDARLKARQETWESFKPYELFKALIEVSNKQPGGAE